MQTSKSEAIPVIPPVPEGGERPHWSVMLPTYNAGPFLENTLRSILVQDPGPDRMQIAVVDDCSPNGEAERIVNRVAPSRIEFYRQEANVGLAGNWNACIARARGHWVHILHQDDLILPTFYERLGRASRERPDAGAAFCRFVYMNGDGHWEILGPIERREAGILDDWLAKTSQEQRIQCASIAVRRAVYERLGGYRSDLKYALDWEMWVRIAASYPVWYEPTILACWRLHDGNESARLQGDGSDIADVLRAVEIVRGSLPAELQEKVGRKILADLRDRAIGEASLRMHGGDWRAGLARFRQACECDPSLRSSRTRFRFQKWAVKLWLRGVLSPG